MNYYFASKVIIPPGYYEDVINNALSLNSRIVAPDETAREKILKKADKLGIELPNGVITEEEYAHEILRSQGKE